jgi:hypothetical protein
MSLWFSIFALVSFSQQRMLNCMHNTNTKDNLERLDEENLRHLLRFFLRPERRTSKTDVEKGQLRSCFFPDWTVAWVWQAPMMLMSFSWMTFLLGYGLYFLTPFLSGNGATTAEKPVAIVAVTVGGLVSLNFFVNSVISARAIGGVMKKTSTASNMSNSFSSERTLAELNQAV